MEERKKGVSEFPQQRLEMLVALVLSLRGVGTARETVPLWLSRHCFGLSCSNPSSTSLGSLLGAH